MPVKKYFKGSGSKVMASMKKQYGEKKGKSVFYATAKKQGMEPKGSMQTGGVVSESGPYSLHEGETIVPAAEQRRANISVERGKVAAGIKDSETRKKFIAKQGEGKVSDTELETETFQERNRQAAGMQTGGVAHRSGPYRLHMGETVETRGGGMNRSPVLRKPRPDARIGEIEPRIPVPSRPRLPGFALPHVGKKDVSPEEQRQGAPPHDYDPHRPEKVAQAPIRLHSGGRVPKTGIYQLEAGETVTPAPAKPGYWKTDEKTGKTIFEEC